jgi:SAM-dependent methyltransferase
MARYDEIGVGYSDTRREDPHTRELIHTAIGGARIVLNVGAGTGSYEPRDRFVIAVEPSEVMLNQRGNESSSSIRCTSAPLPLRDDSIDSSMAILTVHHWDEQLVDGIAELKRVTRGTILVVTFDVFDVEPMWLVRDYFPEADALDKQTFPTIATLVELLGGDCNVSSIPIRRDTPDWTFASFWAHPERVLDPAARRSTSGFSRQPVAIVDRVVAEVERDLRSGEWDRRNGHLHDLDELDVGLRLIVSKS